MYNIYIEVAEIFVANKYLTENTTCMLHVQLISLNNMW